jgi:hypothetical protein
MIVHERLLEVVSPLAAIFPSYNIDVSDINEGLDHGTANCGMRAYAAGLLLRHAYPNENLYIVDFGYGGEHGTEHVGENGVYVHMEHAVARFTVPGYVPALVETTDKDGTIAVIPQNDRYSTFIWDGLNEGYRKYLDLAGDEDVQIDPDEILTLLLKRVRTLSTGARERT